MAAAGERLGHDEPEEPDQLVGAGERRGRGDAVHQGGHVPRLYDGGKNGGAGGAGVGHAWLSADAQSGFRATLLTVISRFRKLTRARPRPKLSPLSLPEPRDGPPSEARHGVAGD